MRLSRILLLLLILMLAASTAFASGFRLPEAGAKAMGMGFAFVAQADNPSAIYYNPAGITQLEGYNFTIGATYVQEYGVKFGGETPLTNGQLEFERQKTLTYLIPNMYFTSMSKETGFGWGIGFFVPFGLGQQYNNWSSSIFRNQTVKIELMAPVINPTIAYKVNEYFSIGAGIDYMYGMANLGQTPTVNGPLPGFPNRYANLYELELKGSEDAWGYNIGILLKPTQNFRIGASYRSAFDLKIKNGDVVIRNVHPAYGAGIFPGPVPSNMKGSATVSMPDTFAIGVAYTIDQLTFEVDADWTFWSKYNSLPISFSNQVPTLTNQNVEKKWKDVCALRFGMQYQVTDPLALRLGIVYDPSPVPIGTMGPELPDSHRMNYMIGAGYKAGQWTIDAAFMYLDKSSRAVNNMRASTIPGTPAGSGFDGKWSGDAWLAGLDISYKF
ncbi:MAG: OmpP1/FadL family transporter [Syntrophorhabdaceae bacterium]|nr:OmpP1/FadL family transporter [Syntrophorhabdaceae bacterium]